MLNKESKCAARTAHSRPELNLPESAIVGCDESNARALLLTISHRGKRLTSD